MNDVTHILRAIEGGDRHAASELLPLIYEELRTLAAQRMRGERAGHTLGATALVHEAYVRLVEGDGGGEWNGRGHFFGAAAEAMRRILIDQARRKQSRKRGGEVRRVDLDAGALFAPSAAGDDAEDLLALDEALQAFEAEDAVKARLVKLRYFAGLTVDEAAETMGISPATAKRHWAYARSWLYGRVRGGR